MQWIARHLPARLAFGSKLLQQLFGMFDGCGGRRVQPVERVQPLDAHGAQQQRDGRKIGAQDLGRLMRGAAYEIFQRKEADGAAGSRAPRASGALIGGSLADACDFECGQARPRRMAGGARQARIDHGGHAFNGDGAFGDVGGQNDFAPPGWAHGVGQDHPVLLFRRLIAVQW